MTDKEIDAVLERRRNAAAAELVPHKGPAVKGNVVHMDFEGLLDGVAFAGRHRPEPVRAAGQRPDDPRL